MPFNIVPAETKIPFTSMRNVGAVISVIAVIASIVALATIGLNLGIDFRGGATVEVGPAEEQVFGESDLEAVRNATNALGLGNIQVKTIAAPAGGGDNIVVVVESQDVDLNNLPAAAEGDIDRAREITQTNAKNAVLDTLRETLGEGISIRREDVVGPTVSGELLSQGIRALVVAISLMLLYIWVRFEWQFSLGAIIALVHDVVLTLGFFALTRLEFTISIIAALLTIVGYSMNDTVVVYDRVRENLRKFKKKPLAEVIDLSLNQTLSRTLMTSLTTLIALVSLWLLGGSVLRGFSLALIWGVAIGTYSSVFIASPMLLRTGVKRDWSKIQSDGAVATGA